MSKAHFDASDGRSAERARPRTRSPWNRKNPYPARVMESSLLTGDGSSKEVRHYVLDLGDSGIEYAPGDGLGVRPVNSPELVARLLDRLGVDGEEQIPVKGGGQRGLADLLTCDYEISTPSLELVDAIGARASDAELEHVLATGDRDSLDAWLWGKDVLDLLHLDHTIEIRPEELLEWLRPLQHRVYSIASSPSVHAGTVHLTVAVVRYRSAERDRGGVCTTHLADRVSPGDTVGVFVSRNNAFHLPDDDSVPIVMIGPGTGLAPFRGFLQERAARNASGRNWLFFGDRNRDCDFLYHDELERWSDEGALHRMDIAFSRDQAEKVYVQQRMSENGAELFEWLEQGAHIYVCGEATRMARDVDTTLHRIIEVHGHRSPDEAEDYVYHLKREKRYLRDVY